MKALIVDDDFTNRLLLQEILKSYGSSHVAVNGKEAVEAVRASLEEKEPYDLICLDIMMPEMDGQDALKSIRSLEEKAGIKLGKGSKIAMVTSVDDAKSIIQAFREACEVFLVKPIDKSKLLKELRKMELIA